MSGVTKKLMSASGGVAGGFTAIEDVFSTYLYTGNGATQTITNGIDLAGEGGLVWTKSRSAATFSDHILVDSERGDFQIQSNTTAANTAIASFNFSGSGYVVPNNARVNASGITYASWTFRKAPRFFDVVTYTGTGAARTVIHNLGTTVGSIIIKRTDTTSNWAVYHRGNTAAPETDFLSLNLNNATADDATYWNDTAPTDSVFTVGTNAAVNASGGTYVAYLFAHDPLGPSGDGSDGLIDCGSYTGTGAAGLEIDLGWEPQFILGKAATVADRWYIYDTMRGFSDTENLQLRPSSSDAELVRTYMAPTATGFKFTSGDAQVNGSGNTYIYIAIRRGPMRAPESGTEVFANTVYAGDGSTGRIINTGILTDFFIVAGRNAGAGEGLHSVHDRLRGQNRLVTHVTDAESFNSAAPLFDVMEGYNNNGFTGGGYNADPQSYVNHAFRRAPEFFDVVAYTGDGTGARAVPHNLGVTPEWVIFKTRNSVEPWYNYHAGLTSPNANWWTNYLQLESTQESYSSGSFNEPNADNINLSNNNFFNGSGKQYIAYLFATLAGVSKVGSYTGNGSSQTINCGFTTGARFILIKRTDAAGDWYVWDTARGIVAANDPHLSLNTTAAEVTTDDSVDPDSSGFIVNQVAATSINVSAASYIFYAVA